MLVLRHLEPFWMPVGCTFTFIHCNRQIQNVMWTMYIFFVWSLEFCCAIFTFFTIYVNHHIHWNKQNTAVRVNSNVSVSTTAIWGHVSQPPDQYNHTWHFHHNSTRKDSWELTLVILKASPPTYINMLKRFAFPEHKEGKAEIF